MKKKVLLYTVTNKPQLVDFVHGNLKIVSLGMELTQNVDCNSLVVVDDSQFGLDPDVAKVVKNPNGTGLNGSANYVVDHFSMDMISNAC